MDIKERKKIIETLLELINEDSRTIVEHVQEINKSINNLNRTSEQNAKEYSEELQRTRENLFKITKKMEELEILIKQN